MRLGFLYIIFCIVSCNFQNEEVRTDDASMANLEEVKIESEQSHSERTSLDSQKIHYQYICTYENLVLDTVLNKSKYRITYECKNDSLVLSEGSYTEVKTGKKIQNYYHNYIIKVQSENYRNETKIEKEDFSDFMDNVDFINNSILCPPTILKFSKNTLTLTSLIGYPGTDYFVVAKYELDELGKLTIISIE
jgi:hypothetical protein